jgi:hypothetical protein
MIKLKDILSEAYAWERQEGKPLPTLAEVQAAYDARMREEAKPDFLDLDDDGDEEESMKSAANDADDDNTDLDDKNHKYTKLKDVPAPYDPKYDDDDDDDDNYYVDEAAKPDFLDLDGDGNETESMKSAAADSTPYGNNISKRRAEAHLTDKDVDVYGIKGTKGTKITNASELNLYSKFTIKSKNNSKSLEESFNKRMLGNLHGHEYILREAFKRK